MSIRVNRTTKKQFKLLVRLMEENDDIAKAKGSFAGSSARTFEFWKMAADKLNNIGPPIKEINVWKKVWVDLKANIKKKLIQNHKKLVKTGCNSNTLYTLSDLEETIVRITCLNTSVSGLTTANKLELCDAPQSIDDEEEMESFILDTTSDSEDDTTEDPIAPKRKASRSMSPTETDLANKRIRLQETFNKSLIDVLTKMDERQRDLDYNLRTLNRTCKKLESRLGSIGEEFKRHNREVEKIKKEKLEMKKRVLNIKTED